MELTPLLDAETPLYLQLYSYVKEELRAGRIPPGTRLPSIRSLAGHLGISRTPVELAYQQLLAEGYIWSKPRSGLFTVALDEMAVGQSAHDPAARMDVEAASANFSTFPAPGESGYAASGENAARPSLNVQDQVVLDFGYGGVDLEHFPFRIWRKLLLHGFAPDNRRLFQYGDLQGELGLRVQIAQYLRQVRGVVCRPEQIVVGAGTYHSLDLLCQLIRGECPVIAAEQAVNDGVRAAFTGFGFQLKPIELESDGIRTSELGECGAKAVYVTPSHQFPYGMTLSVGKRLQPLSWASRTNGYIIENDYDGEFRFGSKPIPSLQGMDTDGRVVYIGTFSKALTPSFRISYLVLPASLIERFRQGHHHFDQHASTIHQDTLARFMQSGHFERHMRRMRRLYGKKHDLLIRMVHETMGSCVRIQGSGSGLHVLLVVPGLRTESELIQLAREVGVAVYPTSVYELIAGTQEHPTVLLGFGGLNEAEIREGITRLDRAWFGEGR